MSSPPYVGPPQIGPYFPTGERRIFIPQTLRDEHELQHGAEDIRAYPRRFVRIRTHQESVPMAMLGGEDIRAYPRRSGRVFFERYDEEASKGERLQRTNVGYGVRARYVTNVNASRQAEYERAVLSAQLRAGYEERKERQRLADEHARLNKWWGTLSSVEQLEYAMTIDPKTYQTPENIEALKAYYDVANAPQPKAIPEKPLSYSEQFLNWVASSKPFSLSKALGMKTDPFTERLQQRERLFAGDLFVGPAIVVESSVHGIAGLVGVEMPTKAPPLAPSGAALSLFLKPYPEVSPSSEAFSAVPFKVEYGETEATKFYHEHPAALTTGIAMEVFLIWATGKAVDKGSELLSKGVLKGGEVWSETIAPKLGTFYESQIIPRFGTEIEAARMTFIGLKTSALAVGHAFYDPAYAAYMVAKEPFMYAKNVWAANSTIPGAIRGVGSEAKMDLMSPYYYVRNVVLPNSMTYGIVKGVAQEAMFDFKGPLIFARNVVAPQVSAELAYLGTRVETYSGAVGMMFEPAKRVAESAYYSAMTPYFYAKNVWLPRTTSTISEALTPFTVEAEMYKRVVVGRQAYKFDLMEKYTKQFVTEPLQNYVSGKVASANYTIQMFINPETTAFKGAFETWRNLRWGLLVAPKFAFDYKQAKATTQKTTGKVEPVTGYTRFASPMVNESMVVTQRQESPNLVAWAGKQYPRTRGRQASMFEEDLQMVHYPKEKFGVSSVVRLDSKVVPVLGVGSGVVSGFDTGASSAMRELQSLRHDVAQSSKFQLDESLMSGFDIPSMDDDFSPKRGKKRKDFKRSVGVRHYGLLYPTWTGKQFLKKMERSWRKR